MNRKAILAVIILSLAGYGYTYVQVFSAIQGLEMEIVDFRMEGFNLFPPSADIVVLYMAINPSSYELEMKVDAMMFYGNTLVTPIEMFDTVRANGRSTFEVPVHITSGIIGTLLETDNPQFTLEGKVTITHRIFGIIPVVFTRTGIL